MSLLDNASLLLTPNAYKEGKLYSVIPSNGNGDFTATRATTATRVNSAGLVDLVPYNLFTWSEMFSNAAWTKTDTTITANTTIAPDGTLTADTMNVTGSTSRVIAPNALTTGTYTLSIWMKILSGSGTMRFNLNIDGTLTSSLFTPTTEWQRFTYTFTAASSAISISFRAQSFVGDIAIWGAQIVEGTSARDYLRTETRLNIPRVDYSLGGCPNILLEPQRTNLALQSSSFDSATWAKLGSSVTANSTTSPSGVQDADTFSGDGILGGHELRQTISFINGTTYTFSVYAKKNTNNFLQLIAGSAAFGLNVWANFDLNSGVVGTVGSATTARIENVGNGWYRCVITGAASVTSSAFVVPFLISSATSARGEINTLSTSVFLWGAQLEAGAYATSYIPTTTASVTRNADSITRNNIFTNGLITAAGGTWFMELRNNRVLTRDNGSGIFLYEVLANNAILIFSPFGGGRYTIGIRNATATTFVNTTTDNVKLAFKWNGSILNLFVNGVKNATNFTFSTLNFNNLDITAGAPFNINEMALLPTPLTDDQLIQLTTL